MNASQIPDIVALSPNGTIFFKKKRYELLAELRMVREQKFADRIRVILLIDEGKKYIDIAKFLFLDEKIILNWRRKYEEGGLENLVNDYY